MRSVHRSVSLECGHHAPAMECDEKIFLGARTLSKEPTLADPTTHTGREMTRSAK